MKRYFLGVDIGTFESRGMLIGEDFRPAADVSVPHTMENPQPGWFEHDAEGVWWGVLILRIPIIQHRVSWRT